jgi:hypothetical protein
MARMRSTIAQLRTALYGFAKVLGDVRAVQTGRVNRRVGRRLAGKVTGKFLGKLFR